MNKYLFFWIFLNIFWFIYLFLAVLGLRFCARAFFSCGRRGPLFIAVRGPLTIAASLVADLRLQTRRLSNCGSWAHLLRGMWDLPRPGLEPVSPALAGRCSATAPPGKPPQHFYLILFCGLLTSCWAVSSILFLGTEIYLYCHGIGWSHPFGQYTHILIAYDYSYLFLILPLKDFLNSEFQFSQN